MRAVFIFFVLLLLLSLAVPVTIASQIWMDGGAVLARAERSGALRAPAASGPLTGVERTIAMNEFPETWRTRTTPCRTLAFLWADIATDNAPRGMPVSQRLAARLMSDRRGTSVRGHLLRIVVACQLEHRFEDPQLLRMWLAGANFGQGAVGLENAAQALFGKPSRDLNAEESARLAVLLRAPSLRSRPEQWAERARATQERLAARAR